MYTYVCMYVYIYIYIYIYIYMCVYPLSSTSDPLHDLVESH